MWVVKRKIGELATIADGGPATWVSRQPTAAAALKEASEIMSLPESQLEAVAWGSIDWSDSGNITEI